MENYKEETGDMQKERRTDVRIYYEIKEQVAGMMNEIKLSIMEINNNNNHRMDKLEWNFNDKITALGVDVRKYNGLRDEQMKHTSQIETLETCLEEIKTRTDERVRLWGMVRNGTLFLIAILSFVIGYLL